MRAVSGEQDGASERANERDAANNRRSLSLFSRSRNSARLSSLSLLIRKHRSKERKGGRKRSHPRSPGTQMQREREEASEGVSTHTQDASATAAQLSRARISLSLASTDWESEMRLSNSRKRRIAPNHNCSLALLLATICLSHMPAGMRATLRVTRSLGVWGKEFSGNTSSPSCNSHAHTLSPSTLSPCCSLPLSLSSPHSRLQRNSLSHQIPLSIPRSPLILAST